MTNVIALSAALIFVSLALFFIVKSWRKLSSLLTGRIMELERQMALVSQTSVPISAAFQSALIKDLTHFHTPEMDALMVRLGPPVILTDDEASRLEVLLCERTQNMGEEISDSERDAAAMLPLVMRRVKSGPVEPLVQVILRTEGEQK
jgi:hypothetical protein